MTWLDCLGVHRFRSAKDAKEAKAEAERKGMVIDESLLFDSNVITPGTEFMQKVRHPLTAMAVTPPDP